MSQQLKSNDLRDVLRELLPAQNNWKNIGLGLGLQDYEVNAINGSNQPSALREMLSKVFNKKYLTWGELINVLRDPNVSCDALAKELAKKYGKAPIGHQQLELCNLSFPNRQFKVSTSK